jgi:hypothetical protein
MAGFPSNFQDHKRLSELLLEYRRILESQKSFLKRLLDGFSQLVRDSIEARRNLILNLLHKRPPKIAKTINAHTKRNVLKTFKKIFIS